MSKVTSLSLFVGTGKCNAKCKHCAGVPLREYAPKTDGDVDLEHLFQVLQECAAKGAHYLSITSSGEPTLSPESLTKVLQFIKDKKFRFSPINLYTNGIRIGEDLEFSNRFLPLWASLGLTSLYVTIHSIDEKVNAKTYGVGQYPPLKLILERIHRAGLLMRANIMLHKAGIFSLQDFQLTTQHLLALGVDKISAWPIRNLKDKVDLDLAPSIKVLGSIESWIKKQDLDERIKLTQAKGKKSKVGGKLTLFPNGKLSSSWCN